MTKKFISIPFYELQWFRQIENIDYDYLFDRRIERMQRQGFRYIVSILVPSWNERFVSNKEFRKRLVGDFITACKNSGTRFSYYGTTLVPRGFYIFTDDLDWLMTMYLAEYEYFKVVSRISEL